MNKSHYSVLVAGIIAIGSMGAPPAVADGNGSVASDGAAFDEAVEMERVFAHRRMTLERLRELAEESGDRDRLRQIDRLLDLQYHRHHERVDARRARMSEANRARFEAKLREHRERWATAAKERKANAREQRRDAHEQRRDAHEQRRDARDQRRDARHEARDDRHDQRNEARNGRRASRQEAHEAHREHRRDVRERRHDARQDRREHDRVVRTSAGSARRPAQAGRPRAEGPRTPVEATAEGRRPIPDKKRRPASLRNGGLALPSHAEARSRAASTVNRQNADSVYRRLRREIERGEK
jgi:hypothetical protein